MLSGATVIIIHIYLIATKLSVDYSYNMPLLAYMGNDLTVKMHFKLVKSKSLGFFPMIEQNTASITQDYSSESIFIQKNVDVLRRNYHLLSKTIVQPLKDETLGQFLLRMKYFYRPHIAKFKIKTVRVLNGSRGITINQRLALMIM